MSSLSQGRALERERERRASRSRFERLVEVLVSLLSSKRSQLYAFERTRLEPRQRTVVLWGEDRVGRMKRQQGRAGQDNEVRPSLTACPSSDMVFWGEEEHGAGWRGVGGEVV